MLKIDYNHKKKKLIIECPYMLKDLIKELPERKFSFARKVWEAPITRFNIAKLKEIKKSQDVKYTIQAEEAIEDFLKGPVFTNIPFPNGYTYMTEPFKHQKTFIDKYFNKNKIALFAEPGTGKSKMSLDMLRAWYMASEIDAAMIMCPSGLKLNYIEEIKKHFTQTDNIQILKKGKTPIFTDGFKFLIVSIESMSTGKGIYFEQVLSFLKAQRTALILDEAHYIKTPTSKRTKNIINEVAQAADYKIAMTGTEVSEKVFDLFSIFFFLDPNIIGINDFYCFKHRYGVFGGYENKQLIGYKNTNELFDNIRPYIYKIKKQECLDLPDKIYTKVIIEPSKKFIQKYKEIVRTRVLELEGKETIMKPVVVALITLLRQVCSGFYYDENKKAHLLYSDIDKNPKIIQLKTIIKSLHEKEQVIIWCSFVEEINIIQKALEDYKIDYFNKSSVIYLGGLTDLEKEKRKNSFLDKECRYFIATMAAGGTGLTLNSSSNVIYFSTTYSHDKRKQSEDRNHRIGQVNKVHYTDLVMKNTIEERIQKSLQTKADLVDYVDQQLRENNTI